jgi:hypothetical protein
MELDCPHLSLAHYCAAGNEDKSIALVDSLDALRLCDMGSFEAVSASDALWDFERECPRLSLELLDFAVRVGLASPFWGGCDGGDLAELVGDGIKRGNLVGLRQVSAAAASKPTLEQRRLVAEIEAKTRGRLQIGGRQHKLIAGDDLNGMPDRNSYEVVPRDDARRTLDRLAKEPGVASALATLLGKARDKLTPDWRPPLAPDGLILLRRNSVARVHSSETGPALTPSQMKKLATKKDWIEIELVDQDGEPYSTHYRLQLGEQLVDESDFPDDGLLGLYEIESGTYKLTIGEVRLAPAVAEEVQEEAPEGTPEEEPVGAEEALPLTSAELAEEEELEEDLTTAPAKEFSIKVVDEYGDYVPDVEVHFGSETMTSISSAATIYTGPETSVQISFGDPAKVANALARHYKNPPATRASKSLLLSADTLVLVSRPGSLETSEQSPFQPFLLNASDTKIISLRQGMKRAKYMGLHNTWFRNNSAVVSPEGEAPAKNVGEHQSLSTVGIIASILRYNEEHPGQKLFLAGHTDRAGKDKDNDALSLHRAKAVLALLEGDKASYVASCVAKHSELDITQLMDWTNRQYNFTCKPTTMTGTPSPENYHRFRTSYNKWVAGTVPSGEFGPRGTAINGEGMMTEDIWAAMFDLYEHNLRQELGEDAKGVARLRGLIDWVDTTTKAVGYGEKHTTLAQTPDGERKDADRRVEAIFFQPGEEPALSATNGDDIYDTGIYAPGPIPAMFSAKKWTAEWSDANTPAKLGDARTMLLDAPGLPVAGTVTWKVYQVVTPGGETLAETSTTTSVQKGASGLFLRWFDNKRVVKGPNDKLPQVEFRFEVETGGRIKKSTSLAYADTLDVTYQEHSANQPIANTPYWLISHWGGLSGYTSDQGRVQLSGLPPGGVRVVLGAYRLATRA